MEQHLRSIPDISHIAIWGAVFMASILVDTNVEVYNFIVTLMMFMYGITTIECWPTKGFQKEHLTGAEVHWYSEQEYDAGHYSVFLFVCLLGLVASFKLQVLAAPIAITFLLCTMIIKQLMLRNIARKGATP